MNIMVIILEAWMCFAMCLIIGLFAEMWRETRSEG